MSDAAYYRNIKFIDDYPSSSDEFRGQPHKSVADTLVSIISSTPGGRAIGLEGTWGSGKSTVIDIARAKLGGNDRATAKDPKNLFFVFDAWAHQGDPLRRVFLQELIQHLEVNHAVTDAVWNEKLEALQTRRKKTTESKAEKLSWVAKAAAFTLPLLPLAYAWFSKPDSCFTYDLPFLGWTCGNYILEKNCRSS